MYNNEHWLQNVWENMSFPSYAKEQKRGSKKTRKPLIMKIAISMYLSAPKWLIKFWEMISLLTQFHLNTWSVHENDIR